MMRIVGWWDFPLAQATHQRSLDLPSATVHEKFDSRDETRISRREKQRRFGDLFGLTDPPDGDGRYNPRHNIRRLLTHQRGIGRTRAEYIGANTTILEFHCPSAHEIAYGRLGRSVNPEARCTFNARNRARENDRATIVQQRQRFLN